MENGQKNFTYAGTLGWVHMTEWSKLTLFYRLSCHTGYISRLMRVHLKIFSNFRENGELPPLLTVRCHHGEIKLKEVTPVRFSNIVLHCIELNQILTALVIIIIQCLFVKHLFLYFQPSDPPIDFDSDDEDGEDNLYEDYWWRKNCVVFHWYPKLILTDPDREMEYFSLFSHCSALWQAAKPIVISILSVENLTWLVRNCNIYMN